MYQQNIDNRKWRNTLLFIGIGILAGWIYAIFSDGLSNIHAYINVTIIGAVLGICVAVMEFDIFTPQLRRKISFIPLLLSRAGIYMVVVSSTLFSVLTISRMIRFNLSFSEVLKSEEFKHYLFKEDFHVAIFYTVSMILIVIFNYQIIRKLGKGYLENIILGTYYKPQKTSKIFMFLNITNSEHIISTLGVYRYYKFVNDIIYDITAVIMAHKGEIYHFVEEQMVIYWTPQSGRKNANCFTAYFSIIERLKKRKEYYLRNYNIVPSIRAALHSGEVVQGEIGYGKTEISFYGDVLNTTSRMLGKTTDLKPYFISDAAIKMFEIPAHYEVINSGETILTGKSHPVIYYSASEKQILHAL